MRPIDHGSRLIRRDPVDALVGRRNVPPGRQEQPGQQVEPGRGGFGKDRSLFIPGPTKLRPPNMFPGRRLEPCLLKVAGAIGSHRLANQRHDFFVIHLDLSRYCAAASTRLGHFPFDDGRAFPAEG